MMQIFENGRIFTSDKARPFVEAMVVVEGVIRWTGAEEDLPEAVEALGKKYPGETGQRRDLQGRTVLPGFVDAHMHPLMLAEYSRQIACLPPGVISIRTLKEEVRRVYRKLEEEDPDHGENRWICGWGYDEGKYEERRSPNRWDLDEASPDRPVFLVRSCEHIRCVNSKALELAGITRETPDPPGGEIQRDERGEPTGILKENARDLVLPFLPEMQDREKVEALKDLGQLLASQGIVAVCDMGNLHEGGNLAYYEAAAEGFPQRVSLYYMWDYFMDDPEFDIPPELMDPGRPIRFAGLKLIGDGSISGRTAWLSAPYRGGQETGFSVYSDESLEKAIDFAKAHKCQISVHAMGGRAIDRIVDRIYREEDWTEGGAPFLRVEHLTEPGKQAMDMAARRGFGFVTQPIFAYCEIETYRKNLGEERLKRLYPVRTMLERGIRLAFSTDAPATSWAVPSDPFTTLKAAVCRKAYDGTDLGQAEKVDLQTAIRLYTKEAAEISGFSGLGMLAPGYEADFLVLDRDIFAISPEEIDRARVDQTFLRGEVIYEAPELR